MNGDIMNGDVVDAPHIDISVSILDIHRIDEVKGGICH